MRLKLTPISESLYWTDNLLHSVAIAAFKTVNFLVDLEFSTVAMEKQLEYLLSRTEDQLSALKCAFIYPKMSR
jgi:hypothetical protein